MGRSNLFGSFKKALSCLLVSALALSPEVSYAQSAFVAHLPEPGVMVGTSQAFVPVMVRGLVVHPDQPLHVDFIVDSGNDPVDQAVIKEQSQRIARYFLAAVTVPEDQLWVNLSPFEKDRIIDDTLGVTALGRDMLAQDYVLKQLTATLIYPEKGLGKEFWAKVYAQAQAQFGTTDIPVDTFNKVWIMPAQAEVFEKDNAVYVTQARLKVMLDSDRTAMTQNVSDAVSDEKAALTKTVMREVVLPAIENEVNEGRNFATIRQVYYAAILAKWYRELIQNTLLADAYMGKNRVTGVTSDEKAMKEQIYQRYIAAYKKGVFDYIKEDADAATGGTTPRKYFSGGIEDFAMKTVPLMRTTDYAAATHPVGQTFKVDLALTQPAQAAAVSERELPSARALMPTQDYGFGAPLKTALVRDRVRRSAEQVIALLKDAQAKKLTLSITGYLRGLDGAGSSLDLPEFQRRLTPVGAQGFEQIPSTTAVASDKKATVRFELAADPNVIEYVAPDYGITADAPVRFSEDLALTDKGRLAKGQVDAVGYVFRNLFGLKGIRIVMEGISPIALAGGMESSNTFNVALLAAGSMLSGADLSYADIVALAVKLENDEFGGLTGGQGHWSTVLGRAQRLVWMSGVKNAAGQFVNNYGVVAQEVLSDTQIDAIEQHTMLVQAGKEFLNGKAVLKRAASLTNNMWTDLLRLDPVGQQMHARKIALAAQYAKAMAQGDFQMVAAVLNEYVDIRDAITRRWINLMMDARLGLDISGTPYAAEFARKVFDPRDAEESKDYEMIRDFYQQHEKAGTLDALRTLSLYTLDPIASLITKARAADIAIFPLGAGGPGSNMMAVSPRGLEHMKKFFESVKDDQLGNIPEIIDETAAAIVKGTGVLRGYMPFKVGREGIRLDGFDQLDGVTTPALPEKSAVTGTSVNLDAAMKLEGDPLTLADYISGLLDSNKTSLGSSPFFSNNEFSNKKPLAMLADAIVKVGIRLPAGKDPLEQLNTLLKEWVLRSKYTDMSRQSGESNEDFNRRILETKFSPECPERITQITTKVASGSASKWAQVGTLKKWSYWPKPYLGNSVIVWFEKDIQNKFKALQLIIIDGLTKKMKGRPDLQNLMTKIAFVKDDSFHLTLIDLVSQSGVDMTNENSRKALQDKMNAVHDKTAKAFEEIQGESLAPIDMKLEALGGFIPSLTLSLFSPQTQEGLNSINRMRKIISDHTGIVPEFDFKAHVSLGYIIDKMNEKEFKAYKEVLEAAFDSEEAKALASITIDNLQLRVFEDMNTYIEPAVDAAKVALKRVASDDVITDGVKLAVERAKGKRNGVDVRRVLVPQLDKFEKPWKEAMTALGPKHQELAALLGDLLQVIMPEHIEGEDESPVHHIAHVVNFATQIGLEELPQDESGLKILLVSALFHDGALGQGQYPKIRETDIDTMIEIYDDAKKKNAPKASALAIAIRQKIEDAIKARREHMLKGAAQVSRMLIEYRKTHNKSFTLKEINDIARIIRHHDDMKIPLLIERETKIGKSTAAFISEAEAFLLGSKGTFNKNDGSNDRLDWLKQLHWEADSLWMDCPDGINVDLSKNNGVPRTIQTQFEKNRGLHHESAAIFAKVRPGVNYGFSDDRGKATLYRSRKSFELFKRFRDVVIPAFAQMVPGSFNSQNIDVLNKAGISNAAMTGLKDVGGIDIQNIAVTHKNGRVKIRFNDDALRDVLKNGFNGFAPVIINITPVANVLPLLGLATPETAVTTASLRDGRVDAVVSWADDQQVREPECAYV